MLIESDFINHTAEWWTYDPKIRHTGKIIRNVGLKDNLDYYLIKEDGGEEIIKAGWTFNLAGWHK